MSESPYKLIGDTNMPNHDPMGLTSAMMDFFGRKSGQTLQEFANEVKALTDSDKAEIRAGLEANGYMIK